MNLPLNEELNWFISYKNLKLQKKPYYFIQKDKLFLKNIKKCIKLNKHDLKVTLGHLGTKDWYNNQEATIELKLNPNKTYDLNTKKYF